MKRLYHLPLGLLLGFSLMAAEPTGDDLEAFRETYIQNFDRIGINTTPGDARLLRILIQSAGAINGVEVGSATGYGALHMGIAFERTGGKLTTIDINENMTRETRKHVAAMKLDSTVQAVLGDALEVLPTLRGEYDFLFIDALKSDYMKYLRAIEPRLKRGAVVVADNVIQYEKDMKDYLDHVKYSGLYETVIIQASGEKQDGMAVSYKLR